MSTEDDAPYRAEDVHPVLRSLVGHAPGTVIVSVNETPLLREMEAAGRALSDAWERHFSRMFGTPYPWPDPNRWPFFVLFPRLDRAQRAATEARHRVLAAFDVLRYGVPEEEWD